jgi:hypothetical protein
VALDEKAALEITAVRAIESADPAHALCTDDDRAWASRAAAEIAGEGGTEETFLATRARLVLERVGTRVKAFPRAVGALRWRPWAGVAIVALAFPVGAAINQVGDSQRINLLAPPLFGLLLWNIAVYVAIVAGFVVRYGDAAPLGPLRRLVARLAGGKARPGRRDSSVVIAQFAGDWARLSAPLYGARAARILHLAAVAFALGLVAGLYVRGIALEYRATWESTFLDAAAVRSWLAAVLAPGAALTGIPVPSAAEVAAIRAPAGENAARWLHLMAGTVALVVVLPRLALALWSGLVEHRYRTRFPLALDEPYFARLLRGFRGGPMRVVVAPYSYNIATPAATGLERLIRRVFGSNASVTITAPVAYGNEDALAAGVHRDHAVNVIALFNATATPEREAHGVFLDQLAAQLAPGGTLTGLIDESALRERWVDDPERLEQRRASFRALCKDRRVACAFATLAAADPADGAAELERAYGESLR